LNDFVYYEFDEPIYLTKPFFIGWTQTTEDKLNIGFDMNKIANNHLYYNIYGEWVQSEIEGAVMMRPLMGDVYSTAVNDIKTVDVRVYPNPASDVLYFNLPDQMIPVKSIQIIDIQGRLLFSSLNPTSGSVNVSGLTNGIYLIRFLDVNGQSKITRFIKN
jgi:hypothetical protein